MRIPTRMRYGLRMAAVLAREERLLSTKELAEKLDVSPLYLRQLAMPLQRAGIIGSVRGARGGYRLAASPSGVHLNDLLRAFGEDFSLLDCIADPPSCSRTSNCQTRDLWIRLSSLLQNAVRNVTLRDVIGERDAQKRGSEIEKDA